MKKLLRVLLGVLLAAFSAVLITISFPPYNLWRLATNC